MRILVLTVGGNCGSEMRAITKDNHVGEPNMRRHPNETTVSIARRIGSRGGSGSEASASSADANTSVASYGAKAERAARIPRL